MWEDAEKGLGLAMSTLAVREKQEIVSVYRQRVLQISGCCFTSLSRAQ